MDKTDTVKAHKDGRLNPGMLLLVYRQKFAQLEDGIESHTIAGLKLTINSGVAPMTSLEDGIDTRLLV
jgi:hypothetical protein